MIDNTLITGSLTLRHRCLGVGLLCFLTLLLSAEKVMAQERTAVQERTMAQDKVTAQERTVTNAKMFAAAYSRVQDTYLSPEEYSGMEMRYISHTIREKDSTRWSTLFINEGNIAYGKSRSENGSTMSGSYHFQYGRMYQWRFAENRLRVKAGGQAEMTAGFIYNTRNGNNPAQAIAMAAVGPLVHIDYDVRKLTFSYEASCPLFGLTFSPNYGQSYYEIFSEGHYDRNVVPTTIVSTPSIRQTLTVDVPWGRTTWRLGVYGDYRQQQVNSLKRHIYSSGIIIGIATTRKYRTR